MERQHISNHDIERFLRGTDINEKAEAFLVAQKQLKQLQASEPRRPELYASNATYQTAKRAAQDAITEQVHAGQFSYDAALTLLDLYGLPYEEGTEASFRPLLHLCQQGQAILLPIALHRPGEIIGHIALPPRLVPSTDLTGVTRPFIELAINAEEYNETELIGIRVNSNGIRELAGIKIGEERIKEYLKGRP